MFVQDFQVVEAPFERVQAALRGDGESLLSGALDGARAEGERLRAKVGPAGWPAVLSKTMDLRVSAPRTHEDCAVVSFSWAASGGASLFPTLEADLEVAPLGDDRTQVVLRGRYVPPGGLVGRGVDRLVLHRVAESTIRALLGDICANLAEIAAVNSSVGP